MSAMTDEEVLVSHRHEWVCIYRSLGGKFPSVNEADAYAAGFRAGLKHARAWRPLTENPVTWPEEGQLVAAKRGDMGALLRREGSMLRGLSTSLVLGVSADWHWLPLEELK